MDMFPDVLFMDENNKDDTGFQVNCVNNWSF